MKKILVVSEVDKRISRVIKESDAIPPKAYNFVFVAGVPVEVPEVYANALIKTYPKIYSVSKLSKAEIEDLQKKQAAKDAKIAEDLKKAKELEVEKAKFVDPFKAGTEDDTPENPVTPREKTTHTRGELELMLNGQLIPILVKNTGLTAMPSNTKKEILIDKILEAQK